jgi:hypothetical protein
MSDDEEEIEEDWRIAKLYGAADKATPESFAALVDDVGTKDAVVLGGMCTDAPTARAHFVVMALIDPDDGTLAELLEARFKLLRATVRGGGDGAGTALVAALEGLVCSDAMGDAKESTIDSFDAALKVLWEREVVSEDELRAWQKDERAGRHFRVPAKEAQQVHDKGREFLEWVDAGED